MLSCCHQLTHDLLTTAFKKCVFFKFSIPYSQPARTQWIEAIEQYQKFDYYVRTYYVCQLHFKPDDLNVDKNRRTVKKGRVPSVFPGEVIASSEIGLNEVSSDAKLSDDWPFSIIELQSDDESANVDNNAEIVISKERFKHLVDSSVELEKIKQTTVQIQNKLKLKCSEVIELKKIISKHEKATVQIENQLEGKSSEINGFKKVFCRGKW